MNDLVPIPYGMKRHTPHTVTSMALGFAFHKNSRTERIGATIT